MSNISTEPPVIYILPQVQADLEAEVDRAGISSGLAGGLLFGHPLDEQKRLVAGWARPRPEVRFGEKDFCLDQSRTTQQLDYARQFAPDAHYCGVWYIHRTPNKELTDEEWVQTQSVMEDPDFRFDDLVCLVICLYFGELTFYASHFNKYHSARGQFPVPTHLFPAAEADADSVRPQISQTRPSAPEPVLSDWYKVPAVAKRLTQEHKRLTEKYHVAATLADDEQMIFRLMPKSGYGKLIFYLICEDGFPDRGPSAFLLAGDKQHRLFSPGMNNWSAGQSLVDIADDMIEWLAWSLDEYMATAEEALGHGAFREAADWLTIVLSINPRKPRAARLLARAQAPLR